MDSGQKRHILRSSVIAAIIYWIIASIRSTSFVEETSFTTQAFSPAGLELWLRLLVVVAIVWVGISLQKRSNQQGEYLGQVEAQQEGLQTMMANAGAAVVFLNKDLKVEKANDMFRQLSGYVNNEIVGRSFLDVISEQSRQQVTSLAKGALKDRAGQSAVIWLEGKQHESQQVVLSTASYPSTNHEENGAVLFLQRPTSLIEQVSTLRTQMDQWHRLITDATLPIMAFSPDQKLLYLSAEMTAQTTLTVDGIEEPTSWHRAFPKESRERFVEALQAVVSERKSRSIVLSLGQTEPTPAVFELLPLSDSDQQVIEVLAVGFDLSEQADIVAAKEAELVEARQAFTKRQEQLQDEIERGKQRAADLEEQIAEHKETITDLHTQTTESEQQIARLEEQITRAQSDKESMEAAKKEVEEQLVAKDTERETAMAELAQQLTAKDVEKEAAIAEFTQQLSAKEKEKEAAIAEVGEEVSRLEAALATLRREMEAEQQQRGLAEQQLGDVGEEVVKKDKHLVEHANRIEALQADLDDYKQWFSKFSAPIMWLNGDGHVTDANETARDLMTSLGIDTEAYPVDLTTLMPEDSAVNWGEGVSHGLHGEGLSRQVLFLTGARQRLALVASFAADVGRHPDSPVLVMVQDITDVQDRQDQLAETSATRESELAGALGEVEAERDRFNGILQIIDEGILVTDVYHRVVLMNRAAEDLLGVRLSDVMNRPALFAVRSNPFVSHLEQTLSERAAEQRVTLQVETRSQGVVPLDITTAVVQNRNAKEVCVITRLRRSEED